MKTKKVDGKFRVGGESKIKPVGDVGIGKHEMSDGVKHVGHIPSDVSKFDQHHGVAPSTGRDKD